MQTRLLCHQDNQALPVWSMDTDFIVIFHKIFNRGLHFQCLCVAVKKTGQQSNAIITCEHSGEPSPSVEQAEMENIAVAVVTCEQNNDSIVLPVVEPAAVPAEVEGVAGLSRSRFKPSRPCPYCGELKKRLSRHIKTVHKDVDTVQKAMSSGVIERNGIFQQLKRDGIHKHNLKQVAARKSMMRERCGHSATLVCAKCNGFFSKTFFCRHRIKCMGESSVLPEGIPSELLSTAPILSEEFKTKILSKFIGDEIGQLCRTDEMITMIGQRLFDKMRTKLDKRMEVKKSINPNTSTCINVTFMAKM
jgi:hypothetical protein